MAIAVDTIFSAQYEKSAGSRSDEEYVTSVTFDDPKALYVCCTTGYKSSSAGLIQIRVRDWNGSTYSPWEQVGSPNIVAPDTSPVVFTDNNRTGSDNGWIGFHFGWGFSAPTTRDLYLYWDTDGFASPRIGFYILKITGAKLPSRTGSRADYLPHTSWTTGFGTEAGTTISQSVNSAPGRLIVQAMIQEGNLNAAALAYNQNTFKNTLTFTSDARGVIGYADGGSSPTTFTMNRASGVDYAYAAFQIEPAPEPVVPSAGSLVLSGSAPVARVEQRILPTAASFVLSTGTPTVSSPVLASPGSANLTLTGSSPAVSAPAVISPAAAAWTLAGGTPKANIPVTATPGAAVFSLSTSAPTLRSVTIVIPSGSTLSLAGSNPAVSAPALIRPAGGTVSFVGAAPKITYTTTLRPAAGVFALTTARPILIRGVVPAGATFALTTSAPIPRTNIILRPPTSAWTLVGGQPVPSDGNAAIVIPTVATVFTLSGLNFNLYNDMPEKFQGYFQQSGYTLTQIKYPASLKDNSITEGVRMLDDALMNTAGKIIVLAQSQGAQVCSRWMRQYAADSSRTALSTRVTFLLTGNPLRSLNGSLIGGPEVGGTTGLPTPRTTPWPIIDFARRYDGWPDPPTDTNNERAVKNAKEGKSQFHTRYDEVPLFSGTHTIWELDNTTFVLTREDPPGISKLASAGTKAAYKAEVEKGYNNRPVNDPVIVVPPPANIFTKLTRGFLGLPTE